MDGKLEIRFWWKSSKSLENLDDDIRNKICVFNLNSCKADVTIKTYTWIVEVGKKFNKIS